MSSSSNLQVIEEFIILLLGSDQTKPIPSHTHLQKEIFILSEANPKLKSVMEFKKHYMGPFSDILSELTKNPIYRTNSYNYDGKNIILTDKGKNVFNQILDRNKEKESFKQLLAMMKMIRAVYDKLNDDELLFLVYVTYPDYKEKSEVIERIREKKDYLAKRLLNKGIVTEARYKELLVKPL